MFGHHRALNRVPFVIQQVLISYLFIHSELNRTKCIYVLSSFPVHPAPLSSLGNHKFVCYICESISALQIRLSVPFSRFHVQVTFYNICLILTEKAMAPHSSTLAWKIPLTEEPGGLQSMGSLRVGHDWATSLSLFTFLHWRRKWQPTPVFLPGESQGWGSLVGCCLWGCIAESDTTEAT